MAGMASNNALTTTKNLIEEEAVRGVAHYEMKFSILFRHFFKVHHVNQITHIESDLQCRFMTRIFVTGFDCFGDVECNPTKELVNELSKFADDQQQQGTILLNLYSRGVHYNKLGFY
jgi:hypothetical protein